VILLIADSLSQDQTPVSFSDDTADGNLVMSAITPVANDCMLVALAGITTTSAQGTFTTTPPSGWTEDADDQDGFLTASNVGLWAGHKQLVGQAGVSQSAPTATVTVNHRSNGWIIALAPASTNATATPTAIAVTTSVLAPTVSTAATATPTAIASTTSIPEPTVAAGVSSSVLEISGFGSFTEVHPTDTINAVYVTVNAFYDETKIGIVASSISSTSSISTPVVAKNASVTASAVPGSTSLYPGSFGSGVSISPTRVPGTTAINATAVSTSITSSATRVPGTTSFFTSSIVHVGSKVTATAIAATVSFTAPTINTGTGVLYGSGVGGWWQSLGEAKSSAYTRITNAFVGTGNHLKIIRLFDSTVPSYVNANTAVFFDPGNTVTAAQVQMLAARAGTQYLSVAHEPNFSKGYATGADWGAVQNAAQDVIDANGRGKVFLVPTLEGGTYIPGRNPDLTAEQWFSGWDMSRISFIGGDMYQWGTDDASAQTASTVLQHSIDLARSMGKKIMYGELGTRRLNPPYSPGISDGARRDFLVDVIALMDANSDVVVATMMFESDNGASNMKPWPITHPTNPSYSPLAAAAYATAASR
jgi:hypothetical protein